METTVLSALAPASAGRSGLDVRRLVAERTGRTYSVGAIYTVLQRLETKGWIVSHLDEPRPQRGGRARRLFTVTADGHAALHDFRRRADAAWGLIPDTAPETV